MAKKIEVIRSNEKVLAEYKARIAELEYELANARYETVVKLLFDAHEQIAHLNGTL